MFKGEVRLYESEEDYELDNYSRKTPNLFVDDGKELTLDFLMRGRSWWNYKDEHLYTGGDSGWKVTRYVGYGTSMFNNSSFARASGQLGIATGQECLYPVETTWLVSPEDSFLSNEIGNRVQVSVTRRDQTVEIKASLNSPGDVPLGTNIREFGIFLEASGPTSDPSLNDDQKSRAMICRAVLSDTGYYSNVGGTCVEVGSGDPGAVLCYKDDPYTINGDITFRWIFGEI